MSTPSDQIDASDVPPLILPSWNKLFLIRSWGCFFHYYTVAHFWNCAFEVKASCSFLDISLSPTPAWEDKEKFELTNLTKPQSGLIALRIVPKVFNEIKNVFIPGIMQVCEKLILIYFLDADEIFVDLQKHQESLKNQAFDPDIPGGAQFYDIHCA